MKNALVEMQPNWIRYADSPVAKPITTAEDFNDSRFSGGSFSAWELYNGEGPAHEVPYGASSMDLGTIRLKKVAGFVETAVMATVGILLIDFLVKQNF